MDFRVFFEFPVFLLVRFFFSFRFTFVLHGQSMAASLWATDIMFFGRSFDILSLFDLFCRSSLLLSLFRLFFILLLLS